MIRIELDNSVSFGEYSVVPHDSLYHALEYAYTHEPTIKYKSEKIIIDPIYFDIITSKNNIYIDFIDGKFCMFLCSSYDGVFPRLFLGSFSDIGQVKYVIEQMRTWFPEIVETQYNEDCFAN